ncbi:MAG: hypothetical protein WAW75_10085 [Gallionella sp.]
MKPTMDMSSYEIELDEMEYGEEIMSADWYPADELVCGLQVIETSADASTAASEMCLRKMYSYLH